MIRGARGPRFAWAAAAIALAQPAVAHHSAALFDTAQKIAVEGVVTKYDWRNPHIYMTLRVTDADGTEHDREIEAGASSVLLPLGLTPTAVAIGERVTIRGNPSKRGTGTMLGRELVKADGSVLPLNIASAPSRKAPPDAVATSIAGTWFPPLRGFGGFGPGPGRWPLTERGRAALTAFDNRQTAHADCIPVTAPTLMLYPVTSVVEVTPDVVKFHVDWMSSERIVYVDGRDHPPNGAPSLHGHSIGRWEGATLVVDTVQFVPHKQGNAMNLPSGPRKHVVERFSLGDDRKHLRYESVLEDPDYLAAPVTYSAEWDYRPDLAPTGVACDLEVARRFLSEE